MPVTCIHCNHNAAYPRQWRSPGVRVTDRERYRCQHCKNAFSERQHQINTTGSNYNTHRGP